MYEFLNSLLPQIIRGSRKALIWATMISSVSILEVVKAAGPLLNWTPAQQEWWGHEALLFQAFLMAVAGLWTHQIAKEDSAYKLGQIPPTPTPAPETPLVDFFPQPVKRNPGRVAPDQ